MSRDTEKNNYITLAIPRDSPLYRALLADAAATGKALSAVALLRLADYYRSGGPFTALAPRPKSSSFAVVEPAQDAISVPAAIPSPSPASQGTGDVEADLQEFSLESRQARANAAAALEALDNW